MKPILSARIDDQNSVHTTLTIFNRGANCGYLTVNTEDAVEILEILSGEARKIEIEAGPNLTALLEKIVDAAEGVRPSLEIKEVLEGLAEERKFYCRD